MVYFTNCTAELYEEVKDAAICGTDIYDHALKCDNLIVSVPAHIEPKTPTNTMEAFGEADQSKFLLFIDSIEDISRLAKIKIVGYDDYTDFYSISGTPKLFSAVLNHMEIELIKER